MNRERMSTHHRPAPASRQRGFSLVELVVVITLIGVLGSLAAVVVTRFVASQQASRERLVLAQGAEAQLLRVRDELQRALPGSVRVSAGSAGTFVEWVPVQQASRWRQMPDTGQPSDALDLADPVDDSFDVIGPALEPLPTGAALVIGNLGTPDADVYAGQVRRGGLALQAAGRRLAFTAAGTWPAAVGSERFFVVTPPLTLACLNQPDGSQRLVRYSNYGWRATQPATVADFAAGSATTLLPRLAACSAASSSALANIGLVSLRLVLGDGASQVALWQQVGIDNTP